VTLFSPLFQYTLTTEIPSSTTKDIDELLYKIFADVTFTLSGDYELTHRVKNQDPRRIRFQHQIELLTILSPEWGKRKSQEYEKILQEHSLKK
jgi:hypothetical protein